VKRFLARPIVRLILGTLFIVLPIVLVQWAIHRLTHLQGSASAMAALLQALVAFVGYGAYVRLIERRALSELPAKNAFPELAAGLVAGALLFGMTVGALALCGAFHVTGTEPLDVMWAPFFAAISAAVVEELLFRGVLFRIVESSVGSWLALALSAVVFGLLHLLNARASLQGAVAIMLESGILLAAAFMLTRHLWLPIGLHLGWNFTQGGVFGIAVSGTPTTGVLHGVLSGPTWLSGGIFGAEASLMAVVICLIAAAALLRVAVRRGNAVPVP
jgi:membrane protease YdiL (CAAX protease family)